MILSSINDWFSIAKPQPLPKDIATQIGAHFEEVAEMLEVLGENSDCMRQMAQKYYQMPSVEIADRVGLLDALSDQCVTAIGVANYLEMDIIGALGHINNSNYSKFEDGAAILNENRKIMKGKHYFKPKLEQFV